MGALERVGDGLWAVDGPVVIDLLVIPYPTRMTVARLADGGLWVASPVACSFTELTAISELGPVRHLLSPTPRHRWRLEPWHALFPDAALWSCAAGPATVGGRNLPVALLGEEPPAAWAREFRQAVYPGIGFEETTFCHVPSGTLLVEDILQVHRPTAHVLVNALIRLGGMGGAGGVPRDLRALTRRDAAQAWAERVLSWDFDQLVMAHGPVVRTGARAWVERAFDWLLG